MVVAAKKEQIALMGKVRDHMLKHKIPVSGAKGIEKTLKINDKTFYNWLQGETNGNVILILDFYKRYCNKYNKGKDL